MNARYLTRSLRSSLVGLAAVLLAGCMLVETERELPGDSAPAGYVSLNLKFEQSQSVLAKSAAGDDSFKLDSMIIVLTAPSATPLRISQPLSGSPDTGVITASVPVLQLPGLRNWKAYFYTIDERVSPARRDTVHLDSVVFAVRPADTATVQKIVSPAFAVLKVRVVSNNQAQVPDSVRFVRLRVDGVVRDSLVVGSAAPTATLNWVRAMSTGSGVVHALGNHGRVLRSTNSGNTWTETILPGAQNLVAGHVTNSGRIFAISRSGEMRWSENNSTTWETWSNTQVTTSGDSVRGMHFADDATGFVVGDNGSIYRTKNTWTHTKLTSNAQGARLNGVHFPSTSVGYVVGENETILRTTDGTKDPHQIVWAPTSGGWFHQTIPGTVAGSPAHSMHFLSESVGRVFLNNGFLMYTDNGGATWSRINNQGTGEHIYDGQHVSPTVGFIVGARGMFRKTENAGEQHAYWGGLANAYELPTSVDLLALHFINPDTGLVVGTGGAIYRTRHGRKTISAGNVGDTNSLPGRLKIDELTSGTSSTLRAVRFASTTVAVAVGDNGTIRRTTNTGNSWVGRTSGTTQRLTGISFANANVGYISGYGGTILKTTNGGDTWTALTSGTSANLWSVAAVSADTVYVSGVDGLVRKSTNGGVTWFLNETPTSQTARKLYFYNSDFGFATGDSGFVMKAVNRGENWTGGGIKRALKAVHFVNASTGWVVGQDGIILKTTDSAKTWVEQHRQNGLMLHAVHFQNANVGWVTGANGEVFKTTNGGATWAQQTTIVTTIPLTWISFRNTSDGFIIGGTNSLYTTANGGTTWSALFAGGMPGARTFDEMLTYKYLKPGKPHTILVEAIDRLAPLRGYQASFSLTVGAGKDTTILKSLTRCGHITGNNCQ